MAKTPDELRADGRAWLNGLGGRFLLQRRLFLLPGICNEDAAMWATVTAWGRRAIPNWDDYARPVTFLTVPGNGDFIGFGDYVRGLIAATYPFDPTHLVGEFDILAYSMGGLDAFAAMVPLAPSTFDSVPRMGKAFNFITFDTPFGGVPNFSIRKTFGDMTGRPDRQSQCEALSPTSPQIRALRGARSQLAACVERVVCYSAGGDALVQVPISSSNLCADVQAETLWGTSPSFASNLIPGASHAGDSAIFDNEFAIASAFGQLLFGR